MINGYIAIPVLVISRHIFEQHEKTALEQNGPILFINLMGKFYRML